MFVAITLGACSGDLAQKSTPGAQGSSNSTGQDGDDSGSAETMGEPLEIEAGLGIGPVRLGGTYGDLLAEIGPPRVAFEYFRVILGVWPSLGIEVVFSVGVEAELMDDSPILSVGTKRLDGFTGPITPGMERSEAEALIGACRDVVDGVHCYHPVGLYLGFDDTGMVKTVAVHPSYTLRLEPPEMVPASGGGR